MLSATIDVCIIEAKLHESPRKRTMSLGREIIIATNRHNSIPFDIEDQKNH